MLSSVLLPQPDAPSRQTNSPGATSRLMWSSAATEARPFPNTFDTSAIETAGHGMRFGLRARSVAVTTCTAGCPCGLQAPGSAG